jgi:DNA (cytosine-5)-methyltransferase 1
MNDTQQTLELEPTRTETEKVRHSTQPLCCAPIKVLNLYAGVGGNRKLWKNVEVTAIEREDYIADAYRKLHPNDNVIEADAHQYLIDHHQEFDFVWSSPPCPTHSRASTSLKGWGIYRYPDMKLYEEIIFLRHFFKGGFVVENVIPYYEPLVKPSVEIDRHYFWANFTIRPFEIGRGHNVNRTTKEMLSEWHNIKLPDETKDQRKLLRNCVNPKVGAHIFGEYILQNNEIGQSEK